MIKDNGFVMMQLKSNATRIFNLYSKSILQCYHKKADGRPQNYEYESLRAGFPELYNLKQTGVQYDYKLFHLGGGGGGYMTSGLDAKVDSPLFDPPDVPERKNS